MKTSERAILTQLAKNFYQRSRAEELAAALGWPEEQAEAALAALTAKQVLSKEGADYSLNPEAGLVAGYFQSHVRGYGFVHVGGDRQYYLAPNATQGAQDGDILLCQVVSREPGKAPAVRVLEFLVRTEKLVASAYAGQTRLGSVSDGNKKIMIPNRQSLGAVDGDAVLATISGWEGRVLRILAPADKPYIDLLNIAVKKGFLPGFPEAVSRQAAALADGSDAIGRRLDLRPDEVVTVDGEESLDLDDGFSLARLADGAWRLGVHIADVAHFVQPGSLLDQEAYGRGLSVYLVDREVPMLPERLSRDLCSLLPGRERLALSCLVDISAAGEVQGYRFAETVVRSRERYTYSQADAGSSPLLAAAAELAGLLNARRLKRGAAYIELPATAIVLDSAGQPLQMGPRETGGPRGIVEEFMVLANELAADYLATNGVSLLYRGNEGFYPGRGDELRDYLGRWGHQLDYPPLPQQLQQFLAQINGRPEQLLIARKLARSLHKSRYSWTPLGHYNLAVERYTHFSSPIRRYSDLFVHRQIKELLNKRSGEQLERDLPRVAEQCSYRERLAQDIEGACLEQKKLEYMEAQGDRVFTALVTDITGGGPLVWLDNTAEGLVVAGDERLLASCQPGDIIDVQVHKLSYGAKAIYFSGSYRENR